jgi:glycerol-3-phosphate acyltransferase PlsY
MLELGLKVLISYLLGSVNGSLLLGRLRGVDIRSMGSGNAGGTNALRTQGKAFALVVMLIDVGKGWLAASWLPFAELPGLAADPMIDRQWLTLACAAAVVHGHCYPVWYDFKGGKGAATAIGALAGVSPGLLIPAALTWILVLVLSGMVGLATMMAGLSLPVYLLVTGASGNWPLLLFCAALAGYIVFTHRSNIQRIRRGEESRMEAVMLLRRFRSSRG